MNAVQQPQRAQAVHETFMAACRASWTAAPMLVGTCVLWGLAVLPVAVAIAVALPVSALVLTLPLLLVTTGVFRMWAGVAGGRPVDWRLLTRIDPGLALITWLVCLAIVWLLALGDPGVITASALGAVCALSLPLAFAYGAVRKRRGAAAVRGGLLLATMRPDLAATLAAMVVLAGFAIILSAGAVVLFLPGIVGVFACAAVTAELRRLRHGNLSRPRMSQSSPVQLRTSDDQ
jgi:hypothetical protein